MKTFVPLVLFIFCISLPSPAQFRALRLSGAVTLPDGTPPPEPVLVRLECPETEQPQAYTDDEGKFIFAVGGPRSLTVPDSRRSRPGSAVGAQGPDRSHVSMTGCVLRAYLAGYTSSSINLGRRNVFESTDVGTLIIKPADGRPDPLVSVNTLAAPGKASKAYGKARKQMDKQPPNVEKAIEELETAVAEYPQFTAAWTLLGEARIHANDIDGANAALRKAVELEPTFAPPYVTLALMELQKGQMAEAESFAGRAIELHPDHSEAHYYRAVACAQLGELAKAEESIRAIRANGDGERYPRTHFLLGNILFGKGDIPAAAAEFERYLELEPDSRAADAVREQLAKWKQQGTL